ncbi:tetratricopeptide repeat protein [Oleidesulfovibrio sp.]|uniref:tetratricopeptide repeat protein n=1 Tax=Oleidesulfovibrio sp. TaxID=2909707 RepID=UPI003A8899DF
MRLDNYLGVYSTVESAPFSAGRPGKPASRKRYWSVWENDARSVTIQALTGSLEADGEPRVIARSELEGRYMHEPGLTAMLPEQGGFSSESQLKAEVDDDDSPFVGPSAAPEIIDDKKPAKLDLDDGLLEYAEETENAARMDFAFALTYLRRGDKERAVELFKSLAAADERYVPQHRHMFTDFGINLRKSGLPEIAILHHERALQLTPADDHIHFNIARAHYDMGDMQSALHHIEASLQLNPQLKASQRFKKHILTKR